MTIIVKCKGSPPMEFDANGMTAQLNGGEMTLSKDGVFVGMIKEWEWYVLRHSEDIFAPRVCAKCSTASLSAD